MVSSPNRTSQFWTLRRISPGSHGLGYRNQPLQLAQTFFQQVFLTQSLQADEERDPAIALLKTFRGHVGEDKTHQAHAGLCLRCRVSHPIVQACIKLANLFGSSGQFCYRDLLPFVLTDDGQKLVVPTVDGTGYQELEETSGNQPLSFTSFSLEVLRTYRLETDQPKKSLSLSNWVYLQTKQHPELTSYLAEFGFQKLSDWALLNRVRERQLDQLPERDRNLVSAFHTVYRRDRRLSPRAGRCPDPTVAQLQEMGDWLTQKSLTISTHKALLHELKQVATRLRQCDVWQSRESLEHFDPETGQYQPRADLPLSSETDTAAETELLSGLQQQLMEVLQASFQQVITARIAKLRKSKKYRPFADQFVKGLQLYYREGQSLKEIAPVLGMSSWDQARRILNPGDFLNQVRTLTLQQLLAQVLAMVEAQALAPWPPSPNYLQQLSEQLETFIDEEIFRAAVAEMKTGSYRQLDSLYAQTLLAQLDSLAPQTHLSGTH